jgi:hypothetical protein
MIMASNSILIKLHCAEKNWFYDLMEPWVHYVPLEHIEDLQGVIDRCESNLEMCKRITENAKSFVKKYCNADAAAIYAHAVLRALKSQ